MSLFSRKLIQFFLIPILFLLFIESYICLSKQTIFSDKKMESIFANVVDNYQWVNDIEHNKVFLLGSSSVRYALSCSKLNELSKDSLAFINLAMDARDPIETYFLLTKLDLNGVRAVYYGLDPWIFAKNYYKYRNAHLYLDMNFATAFIYNVAQDKTALKKRFKALINYSLFPNNSSQVNFYEKKQTIPMDYGSVKLESKPINFNEPINKWFQIDKYGWSQLQFIYLAKILSFCRDKNIDFYAFVPPKRSDYTTTYKQKCNEIHQDFVNHLIAAQFDCPIFGKFDQLDTLGNDNLFQESFHLNAQGQAVYSEIFYKMMQQKKEPLTRNYKWFT